MFKKNSKGITLIEAFLSAMIFVIAVSAIFATLNSLRKPVVNNEQRVDCTLATSEFLDSLRSRISQNDILINGDYSGDLSLGRHGPHIDGICNIWWNVGQVPNNPKALEVNAIAYWPDAM